MYTMCPPGCYHNGFMATPELGHRMYGYTLLDCIVEIAYIYIYIYYNALLRKDLKFRFNPAIVDMLSACNENVQKSTVTSKKIPPFQFRRRT